MFKTGDQVTFFGVREDFEDITNIDIFVKSRHYYKVESFDGSTMIIKADGEERSIKIENVLNEYQVFTADTLTEHLKSLNHQHIAICNKIRQLYRKHNNGNSTFKWQGV